MLADQLIENTPIRVGADGVDVSIRMPWYRALPLAAVQNLRLRIDDTDYSSDTLQFVVNGEAFTEAELETRWDEQWWVLDTAQIRIPATQIEPGEHEVEVGLSLQIPYLPKGPKPLIVSEKATRRLTTEVL